MQAIILAAGMGKRLKELTKNNTKCMVSVNDETLIERVLRQLDALHLDRIILVVGYKGEMLTQYVHTLHIKTPIVFVTNSVFDKTNNIYSLYLAKEYLSEDDTLLLESDLIIEDGVLGKMLQHQEPNLVLVAKYESWMDGTVVTLDDKQRITGFLDKKQFRFCDTSTYYKTVNIYRFSKEFSNSHYIPFLEAYSKALGNNEYYEQVLKVIALLDEPKIKAMVLDKERWYEIDDIQDLDIAQCLFEPDSKRRFEKINSRYGGFWRFPNLLDFCYLVNPYFPPAKLVDEMKVSFDILLRQYPSGQNVNNLLAANYYGLHPKNVLVGNGAAELIKALIEKTKGRIGMLSPSFDEYRNRAKEDQLSIFPITSQDFSYTAKDIIKFYAHTELEMLLLINPDNPSGNYISETDVLAIVEWAENRNILLVVDESFSDFADVSEPTSLLDREVLDTHKNLIVIKSISKSFGVPGVRLGVLATANENVLSDTASELSIWNINSFGEFFLQIWNKYRRDYEIALDAIKTERNRFEQALQQIKYLEVFHSEANYIMCEVKAPLQSYNLAVDLLEKYSILIKDLSKKKGIAPKQCIRLAVRDRQDNDRLLAALQSIKK
ncbi:aminotransferase class I/II-fold pyridoxal phosphate-dependent enzyme [uncultured Sphaerochaeta sp.]|uniref:aminotransferase class I/II-fold pyridoxal phosphate-dependent enzyme n=1 Tax=uncultured Sphaerochaeta sp. TaxID=886478 RepID=UPI002AA69B66|nr:aminotransferase class I/II-fold pyridoxal phosphate-dependent enzyme [uncultured Sphaerochaeta sp.]